MIKQSEVNRIVKRGSAQKRIELLTLHTGVANTTGEHLLSEEEFKTLLESFVTDREIKIYDQAYEDENRYVGLTNYYRKVHTEFMLVMNEIAFILQFFMRDYSLIDAYNNIIKDIKDDKIKKDIIEKGLAEKLNYGITFFDKKKNKFIKKELKKHTYPATPRSDIFHVETSDKIEYAQRVLISLKTMYRLSEEYKEDVKTVLTAYSDFFENKEIELSGYLSSNNFADMILESSKKYTKDFPKLLNNLKDYDKIAIDKDMYNELQELFFEQEEK